MRNYLLSGVAALCLVPAAAVRAADAPNVVVSIQPIHSLVAGVMDGVGEPALIVRGAGSPHAYALKPSEAEALQQADLVVWVGENLESFLVDAIPNLATNAHVVELVETPGVMTLEYREGDNWEDHAHDDHDDHAEHDDHDDHAEHDDHDDHDHDDHAEHDDHDHDDHAEHDDHDDHDEHGEHDHDDHGHDDHAEHDDHDGHDDHAHEGADAHIWLDPDNAKAIVTIVVDELVEMDPDNAAAYQANGDRLTGEIDAMSAEIAAKLEPVGDRPYLVFHDAYQYFGDHFGADAVGSVVVSPERQPGAARIAAIQDRLADEEIVCVFREPQFSPRVIDTIIEGTDVRVGVLDPLGAEYEPGPALYGQLMNGIADGLVDCLVEG
ncbi:MAG: zinc ABC transporter substrate-binding protein [Pseudomonadota bacterium]